MAGLQHLLISQSPTKTASDGALQDSSNPQSLPTARHPAQKQDIVTPVASSEQQDSISAPPQALHTKSAVNRPGSPQSGSLALPRTQVTAIPSSNSRAPSKPLITTDPHPASSPPVEVDPEQTGFRSMPSGSISLQSSTVRNVFLCLAAHNGSVLDTFFKEVADPSEWEVVVWQAPADPAQGDAAQQYLQVAERWQGEVGQFVGFTQAAGEVHFAGPWAVCSRMCSVSGCFVHIF